MGTVKEVETLIYALRERPHVVEFAKSCAERAREYANDADDSAQWINAAAFYADYAAADYLHYAANAYTAARAAYVVAYYADDEKGERELQLAHLLELHAREEKTWHADKSQ